MDRHQKESNSTLDCRVSVIWRDLHKCIVVGCVLIFITSTFNWGICHYTQISERLHVSSTFRVFVFVYLHLFILCVCSSTIFFTSEYLTICGLFVWHKFLSGGCVITVSMTCVYFVWLWLCNVWGMFLNESILSMVLIWRRLILSAKLKFVQSVIVGTMVQSCKRVTFLKLTFFFFFYKILQTIQVSTYFFLVLWVLAKYFAFETGYYRWFNLTPRRSTS